MSRPSWGKRCRCDSVRADAAWEFAMTTDRCIYAGVQLGEGADLGPFVVIGVTPRGKQEGELATVIGAAAVIRSHTVIYAGNRIGARFETGHGTLIREENVIGNDVSIGSGTVVEHHVVIGDRVRVHSKAFIP